MIPIKQTDMNKDTGNCFQACVANILEVPIETVPHFCKDYKSDEWYMAFKKWVEETHDMTIVCFNASESDEWMKHLKGYSLAGGKSPRGDWNHGVVYLDGKLIFDPHPDNTGLESLQDIILFVYIDPSKRYKGK